MIASDHSPPAALGSQPAPPLSLYLHIPWCIRKCPYCDFNSHAKPNSQNSPDSALPEQAYVEALLQDLDADLDTNLNTEKNTGVDYLQDREIHSIFIGGGTPSLFSPAAYQTLFEGLKQRLRFREGLEITLEANPGASDTARFAGYREAGINRLSIGVQSFQKDQLKALGRVHHSDEAIAAIKAVRSAGFDNFNIDLMHGLPGQSLEQALADIDQAAALAPSHLSWYQLTIEANTEFYNRPPTLPAEDTLADIQEAGFARIAEHGFQQYEVSAYAKSGKEAAHNLNYWHFGDYLALGAGAHGKISHSQGIFRYWKTRKPEDYLQRQGSRTAKTLALSQDDAVVEFMMNALRLRQGSSWEVFQQRTGLAPTQLAGSWQTGVDRGLLDPQHLRCTELGLRFLNDSLDLFL